MSDAHETARECVWDYPRPPRLEPTSRHLRIEHAGEVLAETRRAYRVLETSHPPVYYLPPEDIEMSLVRPAAGSSYCEWKGQASYFDVAFADVHLARIAWCYRTPTKAFWPIRDYLAFYPTPLDGCYVDGERVAPQPGDFYGGWITSDIEGPFKGGPGTRGW